MKIKRMILQHLKQFSWYSPIRSKLFFIYNFINEGIKKIQKYICRIPYAKEILIDKKIRKQYAEKQISFGEGNPDKMFYVIRHVYKQGIFSFCQSAVNHHYYALSKGYIPVIAQIGCQKDFMWREVNKNNENAWDIFFEQPSGYTVSDLENSKNIILCNPITVPPNVDGFDTFIWTKYNYKTDAKKWNPLFQNFLKLNSEMLQEIQTRSAPVLKILKQNRVLGLSIRRGITWCQETGNSASNGHPISPQLQKNIEDVDSFMKQHNCSHIFLSCDDTETVEILKNYYKKKLLIIERERANLYTDGKPTKLKKLKTPNQINNTINYLTEIHILSQCVTLHGNRNAGTLMASIWNNQQYEDPFIYSMEGSVSKKNHYLRYHKGQVV